MTNKIIPGIMLTFLLFIATTANAQKLESEFPYKIDLTLDAPFDIGKVPIGKRVIYPVTGGTFEGPKVKGKVKAFGADWVLRLDSITTKLDVRLILETDDGQIISNTYSGIENNNPNGTTYWRITPVFETSS
jgi:sporulation-control protein spo0M